MSSSSSSSSSLGRRVKVLGVEIGIGDVILLAVAYGFAYTALKQLMHRLDPDADAKEEARKRSAAVLRRLDGERIGNEQKTTGERSLTTGGEDVGRRSVRDLQLNNYEQTISTEVVWPEDINVSFNDIGGLNDIIEELKESVIYPLTHPHLFSLHSPLLAAPAGVLLYGPPGCGKTMLAKALAHESGACFINLHISTLTEKWYGDSNKLVAAVFSLARKLQPTIVFIDEIDAVLGTRRSGEHEASGMVKAEFMTHWDGLLSATTSGRKERILILGATNRIQDIDEAILRRMPKKFPVVLPDASQRRRIFGLILKDTKIDVRDFDLSTLVKVTAGMSGSDIKEACRDAAMVPVREYIRKRREGGDAIGAEVRAAEVRGVRTTDFFRQTAGGRRPAEIEAEEVEEVEDEEGEEGEWEEDSDKEKLGLD